LGKRLREESAEDDADDDAAEGNKMPFLALRDITAESINQNKAELISASSNRRILK
jgi:hypothetical protein